jgi:hypothetical protein
MALHHPVQVSASWMFARPPPDPTAPQHPGSKSGCGKDKIASPESNVDDGGVQVAAHEGGLEASSGRV